MKNLTKLLGIFAIGAVISFALAGCDNGTTGDGEDDGGGGNTGGNTGGDTGTVKIICTSGGDVSFHLTTSDVFSSPVAFTESGNSLTTRSLSSGQTYTFTVPITVKCISFNGGSRSMTVAKGKTTTVMYGGSSGITIGEPE
jgi:predicted small secreted protein